MVRQNRKQPRQYKLGPKPTYLTRRLIPNDNPMTSIVQQLPKLQRARAYNPPKLSKPSAAVINLPKSVSVVKNGSPVKSLQSLPINPVRTMVKYNPNRSLIKTNSNRALVKYVKPTVSKKKTVHLHPPIKKKTVSKPNRNTIIQKSTLITTTMKK